MNASASSPVSAGDDHPADDVAAEDVDDHEQLVVDAAVGPCSFVMSHDHTWLGAAGDQLGLLAGRMGALAAPFPVLAGDRQQPVHRRDRAQVDAVVEQPGPHLGRRQVAVLRASAAPPGCAGARPRSARSVASGRAPAGPATGGRGAGSGSPATRPAARTPAWSTSPPRGRRSARRSRLRLRVGVRALGEQFQERVRFSRDLQRQSWCAPARPRAARCGGAAARARPARASGAPSAFGARAVAGPGVAGLAPLRDVRGVQALAAQQRAPLARAGRQASYSARIAPCTRR